MPETRPRPVSPTIVIAAVLLVGAVSAAALVLVSGLFAPAAEATSDSTVTPVAAPVPAAHAVPLPPTLEPTPSHTVQAIMVGLVDPAADGIWNSAGAVVTASGEEAWEPSTDEDWRRLEGHARALARGAEALDNPLRANGRDKWAAPARGLRLASAAALKAAQHRNLPEIYAASEQLLDACQQCHRYYWLPTEAAK